MQSSYTDTVSFRRFADSCVCLGANVVGALFAGSLVLALSACSPTVAEIAPKDFPSADVPLTSGSSPTFNKVGSMWDVSIVADSDDALQKALTMLLGKGFQVVGQSDSAGDDLSYSLTNSSYSVRLGSRKSNNDLFITYGVAKRSDAGGEPGG